MDVPRANGLNLTLTAALAAVPLLAVVSPLGMTPLWIITALGVLGTTWHRRDQWHVCRRLFALVAAIYLLAMFGALWALDPAQTMKAATKTAVTAVSGLLVVAAMRSQAVDLRGIAPPLLVSLGLALAVLVAEYLSGHRASQFIHGLDFPPFRSPFNRSTGLILMMLAPGAVVCACRWGWRSALAMAAAFTALAWLSDSHTAKLASMVGATFVALAWWRSRFAFTLLRLGVLGALVGIPLMASHLPSPQEIFDHWPIPNSSHHRLTIWGFVGKRIAEKPVLGWGLDASRAIPGADDEVEVRKYDGEGRFVMKLTEAQLPLHPHNATLQWWLELGGLGAILMSAFIWSAIGAIERFSANRIFRAILAGQVAVLFVVCQVGFGFWQSWLQSSFWLLATLNVAVMTNFERVKATSR